MMDVTKSNFYQLIPNIKEEINKCDFVCIDCELTGLNTNNDINAFDTQKQYYEKIIRTSKHFLIIQYGVCLFRYDIDTKTFKHQAYNFYVFPKSGNKHAPDHRFLCQSSCIDFLASCGFDFNKLFKEGVPYLNKNEEEKYKENMEDVQKVRVTNIKNNYLLDNKNLISMTKEERVVVDNIFKEIDQFIVSDKEEHILPKCNAYIRRLVYQEAQKNLQGNASLETRVLENKDRILVVTRLKDKALQEEEDRKTVEKEEDEFQKCIGFSTIIKMIVESGKLVIGHNMCLDLLHTIDQFLTPLPYNYEEFKELANYSFSRVLDTKYMASAAPLKNLIDSSVLVNLLNTLLKDPFEVPNIEIEANKKGYSINDNKEHEAGYDAYITGVCFLTMWKYLHSAEEAVKSFPDMHSLEPYVNRLFLMRLQDSPYIYLGGIDPVPLRDHVVYLSFPKSWKLNDIIQLFSPFGNIYVSWINDHSAYVSLQKKESISVALNTLSQSDTYTIMTYAEHQIQLMKETDMSKSSTPYLSRQKKRFADDHHGTVKKQKISIGESVLESNSGYSGTDMAVNNEVGGSLEKVSSPHIMEKKRVQQTFLEARWD